MNLKNAKWKKPDTKLYIGWFHVCEMPRRGKSIETDGKPMVGWGWGWEERLTTNCLEVVFWCKGNI